MGRNKFPITETKLEVKNETDSDSAELFLYGTIREAYPWEGLEDCISADLVRKKLNSLDSKDLIVHINSGGGDVFESIAICNSLKNYNGEVKVMVDALAGSGASVIATAGDEVLMYANAMQMVHKAWTIVAGNSDDLREVADNLEKMDEAVLSSYKSRFVGTEKELKDLIGDETWLTAEECLAFGLADKIVDGDDDGEEENDDPENSAKDNLFNKYKKNIKNKDDEGEPDNESGLFNAFKK